MKNRVNLTRSRELQFVSNLTHGLENEIGAKILINQLLVMVASDRLLDVGLEFDIDPITNLKRSFLPVLVSVMFRALLCPC
jgi:hypothetical protein